VCSLIVIISSSIAAAAPQPSSSYPYYESHDTRYAAQPSYPSYPSRTSPTIPSNPPSSRKLPPLSMSSTTGRDERWQTPAYPPDNTHVSSSSHIRSPTASYPTAYAAYPATNPANAYSYPHIHVSDPRTHPHVPSMNPQSHTSSLNRMIPSRADPRSASPYNRSSSHVSQPAYTPPPVTPTSPEEPMIKKKRKRADAAQLKVLNETYNRTAFPSTEERLALAKALDMSPRSIQIW
jgi:homeobox protein YOX1/YHP1